MDREKWKEVVEKKENGFFFFNVRRDILKGACKMNNKAVWQTSHGSVTEGTATLLRNAQIQFLIIHIVRLNWSLLNADN